jgi:glycosyltransferase involved in cell wall biosynthesis
LRILIIGNLADSFVGFRGDLVRAMREAGHDVAACLGGVRAESARAVEALGVTLYPVELDRRGTSVVGDLRYYHRLRRVIRQARPDLVFAYTVKPVVFGALAASRERVPRVAAMIAGAGAARAGGTLRRRALGWTVRRLYRLALARADVVFFQNNDDLEYFVRVRLVRLSRTVRINGSGVNLDTFPASAPPTDPVCFTLVARLLRDKGVREFAEACRRLRAQGLNFDARLIGPLEPGRDGVPEAEVRAWHADGTLRYLGETWDVRAHLAEASVYVLPSYYPEGIPRTVLEAMATGRPIVTTDSTGCRETVRGDGANGVLVPPRDAAALAAAMRRFIDEPGLIAPMGLASRRYAEEHFDVREVNRTILNALRPGR